VRVAWLFAACGAVAMTVPILVASIQQREQIAWLSELPVVTVWTVLGKPAFDSSWLVAAIAWCALLVLVIRVRSIWSRPHGSVFLLAGAWLVVPLVLLLAADALIGPLYNARYLSFVVPAAAILLAVAFTLMSRVHVTWLLVGAVAVASAPTYVAQRTPFAKDAGSDLFEIADFIQLNATTGDGIYLQDTGRSTLRPRLALYAYPEAFVGTDDIAFEASFTTTGTFSDETRSLDQIESNMGGLDRIWVVTAGAPGSAAAEKIDAALHAMRFVDTRTHQTNRSTIIRYDR
jgi:mannosyltransferase